MQVTESSNRYALLGSTRTRSELGDWLGQFEWDHYVTLTHRFSTGLERSKGEVKRWARRLERTAQRGVRFALFTELTASGHCHHHLLVQGTESLSIDALRRAWRCGVSAAQRYDRGKGAGHYVTKNYGSSELVDWDVSAKLPPARR